MKHNPSLKKLTAFVDLDTMEGESPHTAAAYALGYHEGASVAFGLMGMAETIKATWCKVCRACGDVSSWRDHPCQCWNDE